MPPFRNILNRKPATSDTNDNNETTQDQQALESPRSAPLTFRNSREEVPNEYKLSVVNDSGVYLPPSPPEKQSFWSRSSNKTPTTNHRNLVDENEPFSISRESFDSYRRSFDISAKSPVLYADNIQSRTSLDSRFSRLSERPSTKSQTTGAPQTMEEETFEDVRLADEDVKPKKKGLFARFGDNSSENTGNNNNRPSSSHLGFRLPGRKRGQSGQGAELSNYKLEVPTTEV
ncbi:conserved hypothetical protein [Talaromyces stipitatus ATCC 10500]|uniref:Uncharacterized protein n=1 Tax=Talaromyces stipitatus (strain ATCC 10500 / CBS 375.48 / QM 6759 / NRRL 1006) TaxID=441959 RepID=B8LW59_TALSN|nr:uncharacterized protein TSTA_074650 [Talaromyces stipitatus ATCC 10500]EED24087.1 conserved hypothetical protein [Talaromyces stipitatus ATCC 10500]